jgi:hydroxymethylpyrimidine/phosphomethylpyrimidine kinase
MSFTKDFQPVALTIAGSDPSGGAGIQADLKTFTSIGVYAGAVISSLTVQNTQEVFAIQPVNPAFVKDQIDCICRALADYSGEVIYDPVLVSSSGRQLIDREGYDTVRTELLELCTVLTPNIPELSLLTERNCTNKDSLLAAAESLLHQYGKMRSIIVTGGHSKPAEDTITDYLLSVSGTSPRVRYEEISHPRIASQNTHGTGCTFSAAFTAYHLLNGDDSGAFHKATGYMDKIIKKSGPCKIGHGTGPLIHYL